MLMTALVKTKAEPGCMEIAQVEKPVITPDQVLVNVKYCGICGTDHSLRGWNEAIASSYKIKFPAIFGHEFSGVVAEVGSNVSGIEVGERVTVNPIQYCNTCSYCAVGAVNICDNRPFQGTDLPGGFAEYIAVRAQNIVKLPDNVSLKAGAVMEPFCVAIHAIDRAKPELGQSAVVVGPGAIGLMMVAVLKFLGVGPLIVVGTAADKDRLEFAKSIGADAIINSNETDPVEEVRKLTGGRGADVVYDAAGHFTVVPQAMLMAAKRGRIGVIGLPPVPSEVLMTKLAMSEISIVGSRAYELKTWYQAAQMISAGLNVEPFASHVFPMADFEEAFKLVDEKQGLRILLAP
ncbi:MAG: zinc-dependent alcohol dehydrogenase [Syntrophomonadaceae bacterium]|jgi:2-desacetyl-2-hydroxyethyl bacteriochlorophyllide A dehydrogenase